MEIRIHNISTVRQVNTKKNRIDGLFDGGGTWRCEEDELERVVVEFYEQLFTTSSSSDADMLVVLDVIIPTISAEMNLI